MTAQGRVAKPTTEESCNSAECFIGDPSASAGKRKGLQ